MRGIWRSWIDGVGVGGSGSWREWELAGVGVGREELWLECMFSFGVEGFVRHAQPPNPQFLNHRLAFPQLLSSQRQGPLLLFCSTLHLDLFATAPLAAAH